MADMPTIIETGKNNDNGWGGNAWGAGVGGFIGSLFGNGGFGGWGWGGNGRAGQVGADVALGNAIQNVQNAVQANGLSQLQSGAQMYFARQWPREAVISFCASIVRFLDNQTPKQEA